MKRAASVQLFFYFLKYLALWKFNIIFTFHSRDYYPRHP